MRVDESVIRAAESKMLASGVVDKDLLMITEAAKKIRECECTPLYILDLEDGSLAVFIDETYNRLLH